MSKTTKIMLKDAWALSIVAPSGVRIAQGLKTLEVRSWRPDVLPIRDLLIIENDHFLTQHHATEWGRAVAWIDIESVHPWQAHEVEAACASAWSEGYFAWVISHVRPLNETFRVLAKRKLYKLDMAHDVKL